MIKTRDQFEALRAALTADAGYAPHVLGLFAYQDLFNDRNEEDLTHPDPDRCGQRRRRVAGHSAVP